jgi:membrane-bound lytic murein transglycosylase D
LLSRVAIAAVVVAAACAGPRVSRPVAPVAAPEPAARGERRAASAPADTLGRAAQQAKPLPVSPPPAVSPLPAVAPRDTTPITTSEVNRRATEVFGDSIIAPPAVDSAPSGPSWDIEVRSYETTARVAHYVRMFTGPAKERIEDRLRKGTRYEPMIRTKMREGGLPEDMYYLALVESGFDPNAYSRAAAVGMWQFMTSTARDMGLRVDWWIDERRDPVRSTGAAVRFIKGLKEQFGSLYLAAAAYNGGPGRIARGLTRYADDLDGTTGEDLFFALAEKNYLRNETREYVPQLIAAALVAKDPDRYGFRLTPEPPLAYDSARVGPATSVAAIAAAASSAVRDIQELNPQILRGVTPPDESLFVRLPMGAAERFAESLEGVPPEVRRGLRTVESKKGQTMANIARSAGITAGQLAAYNPRAKRLKSGSLVPGQRIVVPTPLVVAAATAVPDPSIERYSKKVRGRTVHVVKARETLSGIAKQYHTTTAALMKANGLRRALIFPGQALAIVGSSRTP